VAEKGGTKGAMTPEEIRAFLTGEHPGFARHRKQFRRIPSDPRCKLCQAPFAGVGSLMLARMGYRRSGNAALCMKCVGELRKRGLSGVEIPVSMLFSDVRGSTAMGERMSPSEFHTFLDRFYRIATAAIAHHDGIVDKIVGDEVIGLFFGGITGPRHAAAAVRCATELGEAAARPDATPSGPIPIGTAVHSGTAFVGASGPEDTVEDFTALGDPVNTTARLASAAGAGEVLVSVAAAQAAGAVDMTGVERRTVPIRGRTTPIDVLVLRPAAVSH
jgi:adenylate cyclase